MRELSKCPLCGKTGLDHKVTDRCREWWWISRGDRTRIAEAAIENHWTVNQGIAMAADGTVPGLQNYTTMVCARLAEVFPYAEEEKETANATNP